jgi:hypothetical protein
MTRSEAHQDSIASSEMFHGPANLPHDPGALVSEYRRQWHREGGVPCEQIRVT